MQPTLAVKIGRPDLVGIPPDRYQGTSGGLNALVSGSVSAGGSNVEGRLTAGLLVVLLVGYVAFTIWTRDIQA